ncbi:MAG: hypothetical protein ACE5K4_09855 [Candidatus Hydrothermarchaeota archaeon]
MKLYSPHQLATLKWRERLLCASIGLLAIGIPPLLISLALAVITGVLLGVMLAQNVIFIDELPAMAKAISNMLSIGLSFIVILILIYLAYNIHKHRHLEKIERILIVLSLIGIVNSYGIVTSIGAFILGKNINEEGEINILQAATTSILWVTILAGLIYFAKILFYNILF